VRESEFSGIEFRANDHPIELRVDDVEAARAELESRGVAFEGGTIDSGVCHQAYFQDPDGNALAIHHRYASKDT
jgi:catechol 2,3-dioxygenase-like lactoylglutathione lyase family enzyme